MKCNNCGENLNTTPEKMLKFCSYCGKEIVITGQTDSVNNVEIALCYIKDNYGIETLLGNNITTYFTDITKNQLSDEGYIIKILQEKGALNCLKDAVNKPVTEQIIAINASLSKLPHFLQNSKEAKDIIHSFATVLGWQQNDYEDGSLISFESSNRQNSSVDTMQSQQKRVNLTTMSVVTLADGTELYLLNAIKIGDKYFGLLSTPVPPIEIRVGEIFYNNGNPSIMVYSGSDYEVILRKLMQPPFNVYKPIFD